MEIDCYLAMTAAEIANSAVLPEKTAWMACHFSSYGTGLSNLPDSLPAGSLLILNDRTPWRNHDPRQIADQVEGCLAALDCRGLLLDFQRPGVSEVAELVSQLCAGLSCPVAVTEAYCKGLSCPVFLSPVPLGQTVAEHLAPWQGREIWLELALDSEEILLTPEGCTITPLLPWDAPDSTHRDSALHCGYSLKLKENSAGFTLSRTREDLAAMLKEAANHGVTTAVGLWQELA